tara:strand:+ start:91 stop:570 length:480 start_codon:yes stop_codon:yes gene_type:complete
MNFRIITSIVLLISALGGLNAQETVSAAGGDAAGIGGSASYTVGQVTYTTNTGANVSVAQGVQQPYEVSIASGVELKEINLDLLAYPNPTNNTLTLNIGNYNHENLTYKLYDLHGKLLDRKQLDNSSTKIEIQDLPVSTYLLNVLDNNSLIKTFRIVKN